MGKFDDLTNALVTGKAPDVGSQVQVFLDEGIDPQTILDDALLPGMDIVGDKFKKHEFFVPQVLFAARAMAAGMDKIRPLLIGQGDLKMKGTVVIGTARGDQHDIGKNLVVMMLESGGFNVVDLGTDVSPEQFVEAVNKENADIVSVSALMTTTMAGMLDVVKAFEAEGNRDSIKIVIGGAPVSDAYAREIGADGYADNATDAVELVSSLV